MVFIFGLFLAWSAIDSSPDMSSEAGVFIANNLSLYEQLTL